MDDEKDLGMEQEFDLDSILNEFHDPSGDEAEETPLQEADPDLDAVLQDFHSEEASS